MFGSPTGVTSQSLRCGSIAHWFGLTRAVVCRTTFINLPERVLATHTCARGNIRPLRLSNKGRWRWKLFFFLIAPLHNLPHSSPDLITHCKHAGSCVRRVRRRWKINESLVEKCLAWAPLDFYFCRERRRGGGEKKGKKRQSLWHLLNAQWERVAEFFEWRTDIFFIATRGGKEGKKSNRNRTASLPEISAPWIWKLDPTVDIDQRLWLISVRHSGPSEVRVDKWASRECLWAYRELLMGHTHTCSDQRFGWCLSGCCAGTDRQ